MVMILATAAAVLSAAVITGYVRPEIKLPSITLEFLATNLFFTCIAEEAFFRGLIQERMTRIDVSDILAGYPLGGPDAFIPKRLPLSIARCVRVFRTLRPSL